MKKKIYPIVASLLAISIIMGGCGKKDDIENNNADKTVITSDFTSYYIAKRLVDGTGIAVDGIDFSQIDEEEGLSGRDRNKIKNATLFIDASFIGKGGYGIDEDDSNRLKFLHIGDFIERKENSKDENKIYTMPKLHITKKNDNTDDSSNNENGNGQQLIVNPNANKNKDSDNNTSDNSYSDNTESNNENNNNNNSDNNNSDNDRNNNSNNNNNSDDNDRDSSSNNNNNPDMDKNNNSNNEDTNSSNGNKGNNSSNENLIEKKEGLCFIFTDIGGSTPSGTCDDGYSISNCPIGHRIKNDEKDEYHTSICQKIKLMKSVTPENEKANYFIIDNNAGGYVVLQFASGLYEKYTVLDGIDKIRVNTNSGYTNVICDTSVKSLVQSYETSAKADTKETNEKIVLAKTVDFSRGYWLDVKNTRLLAEKTLEKLIEIDPENKNKFEENYNKLDGELASLDDKYQYAVDSSENKVIFIGGGFVYKYMVDSYGIDYISIYDYSKQDTVTPTRLINFADLIDEYTIKYIVKDKLSTMDGITSVRSEINHNLNVVIIDTLEYVEDWENNDYFDLMDDNYIILKKSLY